MSNKVLTPKILLPVRSICPMCGESHVMELTEQEYTGFQLYQTSTQTIQELLPELLPAEREFLKSGYCPKCQEMLFGNGKTNRIKETEFDNV